MKTKFRSLFFIGLFFAFIILINTFFYQEDEFSVSASSKGTITATSLNVRTGAGTSYDVLINNGQKVSLTKGSEVTILKTVNDWYYVSFLFNKSTVKGYVLGDYVTVKTTNQSSSLSPSPSSIPSSITSSTTGFKVAGKVIATKLNVRLKPSTTAGKLTVKGTAITLTKNQSVTITSEKTVNSTRWYYISFQSDDVTRKGYVMADYIRLTLSSSVKAKISSSSSVKVQTAAGSGKSYLKSGNKVVTVSNGKLILITKETTINNKKWFQISFVYNNSRIKGYVPASKVVFRSETTTTTKTGTVNATSLKVRTDAGLDKEQYVYNNQQVKLVKDQQVTILSTKVVDNVTWYYVSFTYDNTTLKGYVSGDYITVNSGTTTPTTSPSTSPSATPSASPSTTPTLAPTTSPTVSPSVSPSPTPTATPIMEQPLSDSEFEQSLTNQGFPDSYKPYLRSLHQQYPYWKFTALQTGLDWNTVIAAENVVGKNLISNAKTIAWKSLDAKAYNWETDRFIAYDGSSWVTASKQALEYYMDPRNFLTPSSVFQFESLEYRSDYQTKAGVEKILASTPLSNAKYSFTDELSGLLTEYYYSDTFIKAAEYSGVSPYHLASRVKQEVVTSPTTLSSSVSGTVAGYEGYYNFYNIGATHSTTAGGAVANGLKYAMNGSTSVTNNALFLIPWNNPYKAIVGGGKFIGNNYINKGQNTGYLQKFNVTSYSRYNHQYMANIEAANAESAKTFYAYKSIGDVPIVFSIPVYSNMPATPCPVPSGGSNPNNWLKTLTISNYPITPTFQISDAGAVEYTVIVDYGVSSVTLTAAPVSTTAVVAGTGTVSLAVGTNRCTINVTAQNGDIRTYTINIIRNAQPIG